jgi:hypothetical protein
MMSKQPYELIEAEPYEKSLYVQAMEGEFPQESGAESDKK